MKQVVLPGGLTVSYKYDALGRRIQRTTSAGDDERYVYDGQDVLLDLDGSLAVTDGSAVSATMAFGCNHQVYLTGAHA